MIGKISAAALGLWCGIRPFRALAADPAAVPIDVTIYLALIALVVGSILTLVVLAGLQARRMRRKRVSSDAYFHPRGQAAPVMARWDADAVRAAREAN